MTTARVHICLLLMSARNTLLSSLLPTTFGSDNMIGTLALVCACQSLVQKDPDVL